MKRRALALGAALLLLGLMPGSTLASASNLNQSNYAEAGHSAYLGTLAQTFTPDKSGMLSRVGLNLYGTDIGASYPVQIENVDGAGAPNDSAILTRGFLNFGLGSYWDYVPFSPPVHVTAGTKYAIVVSSGRSTIAYGSTDTYPGGQAYGKDGSWYPMSNPADLAFEAYVDTVTTQLAWDKASVVAGVATPLTLTATMTFANGEEASNYSAILSALPSWFSATGLTCSALVAPADCTSDKLSGQPSLLLVDPASNGATLTFTLTGTATPLLAAVGTSGTATGEACLVYPQAQAAIVGVRPNAPRNPGCADGSAAVGRACGLRPVPPYAAPTGNQRGILKSQIPYSGPLETCPAQGYHCGGPLTVNLHHFRLVSHTRL